MNTYLPKTILVLLAVASSLGSFSQTFLLQEDFEGAGFPPVGWTSTTPAGNYADGWTYGPQSGLLSGICVPQGSKAMVSQWATYYPNNTWTFTPGLTLAAGTTYILSFKQCVQSPSSNKTESLKITVGTQANAASQTQTLLDLPTLTNTSSSNRSTTFTPGASGVYYFAFHCYSAANQRYLSIDSVNIYTNTSAPVFPSPYCGNAFPQAVEPITRVEFAGIANNSSAALNTNAHEDFTAQTGHVVAGQSYPITIKGNTNGANYSYVKVYVDWNQNQTFTDAGEEYALGTLYNSNGTDATFISASISVPNAATLGTTRMRVIKKKGGYPGTPCNTDGQGQSEEYTLEVTGVTSVDVNTQNNVPAYITTDGGNLQIEATVYPSTISQAVTWAIVPGSGTASINSNGLVTAQSNGNVWAKATSVVDPSKKDSLQITIINQTVAATGITVATLGNVPAEITAANTSLTLVATITPANASQAVVWEIVPVTGNATINSTGTISPISNGTVWAIGKASSNTALQDTLLVTINRPNSSALAEEEISEFQVYPNPVNDVLILQSKEAHGSFSLILMDITGKTVLQQNISGNQLQIPFVVNLSFLKNGVYILHLAGSHIRHTQKIVKE